MTLTPIHAIQYLAPGSVVAAVAGTITKVYPERKCGTNSHGDWSFQKAKFRGTDGNEIAIKFDGYPLIEANWVGHAVLLQNGEDPRSKAITVEEYTNPQTSVSTRSLKVNGTARITWNPEGLPAPVMGGAAPPANAGPPQTAPSGPPQSAPAAPPQATPPQRQAAPPQQDGPRPIFGATVGMAINNACSILQELYRDDPGFFEGREFSRLLHQMGSDILRVSRMLEDGKLADTPARRGKGNSPAPAPQQQAAPPPPQQQAAPPVSDYEDSMSDDDIPF